MQRERQGRAVADEDKMCMVSELIIFLEKQTGLDLQSSQSELSAESLRVQNEELFPFIKSNSCVLPEPKNQICLTLPNAMQFVLLLAKVRPELATAIGDLTKLREMILTAPG